MRTFERYPEYELPNGHILVIDNINYDEEIYATEWEIHPKTKERIDIVCEYDYVDPSVINRLIDGKIVR